MCCLQYEENSYEYLNKITPKRGSIVDCKEGRGVVVDVSLLAGKLKVALDSSVEGAAPVVVNREECVVVKEPESAAALQRVPNKRRTEQCVKAKKISVC